MICLQSLIPKYADQPPDVDSWGPSGSLDPETDNLRPGWWREWGHCPVPSKGARFEAKFFPNGDPDGLNGSPGDWYLGTIEKVDDVTAEPRLCHVLFDDGERTTYPFSDFIILNDVRLISSPEERIEKVRGIARIYAGKDPREERSGLSMGPGPWETWLKTYLPDLLLTIFRVARLDPVQVDKRLLDALKYPLSCDDDVVSDAGTPAQPKRARHRARDA